MRTGILQLPEGNGTFLFSKICRVTGNIYSLVFLGIMKQAGVLGNKFAFLEKVIHPNDSDENTQELFSYHLKASSLQQTLTELLLCAMDCSRVVVVVQLLNHVQLFVTPWTVACQASLSFTISQSLLKLMSIESVMPSNHLVLCRPLICSSIKQIMAPYLLDCKQGIALHAMQGNRASSLSERQVSWFFSSFGGNMGYVLELWRG